MPITLVEVAMAWIKEEHIRRFHASFDDGPWCTCDDLPLSDPCGLCVESARFQNWRMTVRPPRKTAIMLRIAEPEGPRRDEVCTCLFVDQATVCPGCSARGFTTNETSED